MENSFFIEIENKIQGIKTRLEELHWSSPSISIHKLIDEFQESLGEFNDAMIEYVTPFYGFLTPGTLNPVLPKDKDFGSILENIRGLLAVVKKNCNDEMKYSGLISLIDDFYMTVNKYIYLNMIGEKK